MKKNLILIIAILLLTIVIVGELCVYFGYDLYYSENGIFLRHKVYIATYQNMSESELRQRAETGDADAMAILSSKIYDTHKETECKEVLELAQKSADKNCSFGKTCWESYMKMVTVFQRPNKRHLICSKRLRTKKTL